MPYLQDYETARTTAAQFDGMMSDLSIAIFQSFLSFQKDNGITGDMIEYGVYRGKSASVILHNLGPDETATLVDVADYPEFDKLRHISTQFRFCKGKSEALVHDQAFVAGLPAQVRFSHHDASHSFENVTAEMTFMEGRIAPGGLMVLDDFGNASFMQVVAACFSYLAGGTSDLEVLLYSNNKAYLCRKADFDFYSRFLIGQFLPQINSTEFNCYLARTEKHPQYRGFGLVLKPKPDMPDLYGRQIYGDRYYTV